MSATPNSESRYYVKCVDLVLYRSVNGFCRWVARASGYVRSSGQERARLLANRWLSHQGLLLDQLQLLPGQPEGPVRVQGQTRARNEWHGGTVNAQRMEEETNGTVDDTRPSTFVQTSHGMFYHSLGARMNLSEIDFRSQEFIRHLQFTWYCFNLYSLTYTLEIYLFQSA